MALIWATISLTARATGTASTWFLWLAVLRCEFLEIIYCICKIEMDYSSIEDVMGDKHGEESSPNPTSKAFILADDFKIIQMTIKDAENKGKVLWQANNWSLDDPESEQCV